MSAVVHSKKPVHSLEELQGAVVHLSDAQFQEDIERREAERTQRRRDHEAAEKANELRLKNMALDKAVENAARADPEMPSLKMHELRAYWERHPDMPIFGNKSLRMTFTIAINNFVVTNDAVAKRTAMESRQMLMENIRSCESGTYVGEFISNGKVLGSITSIMDTQNKLHFKGATGVYEAEFAGWEKANLFLPARCLKEGKFKVDINLPKARLKAAKKFLQYVLILAEQHRVRSSNA